MIRQFTEIARKQGANVVLEVWENMNHDFQAYGNSLPQSQAALSHIGRVIRHHVLGLPEEVEIEPSWL
jgi:acetyl esterase/lipase